MRFQLLNGRHIGADPANPGVDKTYNVGDVIETNVDLIATCEPNADQNGTVQAGDVRTNALAGETFRKFKLLS